MTVRITADDMGRMIGVAVKHRANLHSQGLIDHAGRLVDPQPMSDDKVAEAPTHKAWCLKCKGHKVVPTKRVHDTPNGAGRAVGDCPTCGTETHAFHSKADAKKLKDALASTLAQTGGA